jgi:hypothetical protein
MPTPRVYYVVSAVQSGGILTAYRHVDILNANGIPAAILHQKKGERCTWFKNETVVTNFEEAVIHPSAILALPESWGPQIASFAPSLKKVIFNQNAYYTCLGYDLSIKANEIPYTHPAFLAALVVSDDNKDFLSYLFPMLPIMRVHLAVDSTLFSYSPHKKKKICLMPRKGHTDAQQVLMMLKFRNALKDWEIEFIHEKPHHEVARIMRESRLYLSFSANEGFGLAAAEAMSSGCVVIGYHGNAGKEFYKEDFSFPIAAGDIMTYARTLENVLSLYDLHPEDLMKCGERASDFIRTHYSLEKEKNDLLTSWNYIFDLAR